MKLKVVYVKSSSKSFSWSDGYYAIKKKEDNILHLWKIEDGKLQYYSDEITPDIICTSVTNSDVQPTDLFVEVVKADIYGL